ncbi:DUF1906 domain-containing protein [Actinoplanes sp. KI2]|uniref:glycoside hydrolase domain-containing protein n=1 Tax=Actinoplanes sp. KI2 TaxID=2983315 RepID=UPI0021D571D0|nr:glycoside hydrolase domain-containing protein [Actinoplanes sp. KI2]MCU7731066.1 DUF1906 domain-containing protein [Actinoplanes sp. KI2]
MAATHTPRHAGAAFLNPAQRSLAIKAAFLVVVLGAALFTLARTNATAATAFSTQQPGTFAGKAFDACTAPSSATMAAWKGTSPYGGVGIYIGGVSRACSQANLTAAWVQTQVNAGWKLLPLYVGPQASCTTMKNKIDNTKAVVMGQTAATDAVTQAAALGLAKGSVLIYDMEAYDSTDAACRAGVLAFMNGWTSQLHYLGYASGYYSSVSSGIADQIANYSAAGYSRPDYVDFARWDKQVTVTDVAIPATAWPGHRRMKQYQGGHQETYGGVTINIDSNLVDYSPLPSPQQADFTGNGWSDVVAKQASTGDVYLYPGNGMIASEASRKKIGSAWTAMNAVVRIGDLNRDGKEDLVARQTNGDLWFYPGTGSGLGTRKKIATKWTGYREITGVGDFNRDGYPDLVAIGGSALYLFPGKSGTTLGSRVQIGVGWAGMTELTGIGDLTKDGYPDLVARDSAGTLWVYRGNKTKLAGNIKIGSGWNGYRDLVGVGDYDRDGTVDLAAVSKSDNGLWLFLGGNGTVKFRSPKLATMSGLSPLG